MNQVCYTLAIRQMRCQNSIKKTVDNVYTNIVPNTIITLSFGYFVKLISTNSTNITIQLSNSSQIPNLVFNIPAGSYKIFDLPTESGTLRVYIGATAIDCQDTIVCCRM
ncbi:MAG: hypothetical protein RSB67_01555 [Clostridia bacterium]